MITDKKIREALKKDFNHFYQPEYSTDYALQRMDRKIEIEIMSLNNLFDLISENEIKLKHIQEYAKRQTTDQGLWFNPGDAAEAHPQSALKEIHKIILKENSEK